MPEEIENKFTWNLKDENSSPPPDQEQEPEPEHPAWGIFRETYFPALESEDPEYLTTANILERLNAIIQIKWEFPEALLFGQLQDAGFKQLLPAPAGLFLWMIKESPGPLKADRKLIGFGNND